MIRMDAPRFRRKQGHRVVRQADRGDREVAALESRSTEQFTTSVESERARSHGLYRPLLVILSSLRAGFPSSDTGE